MNIERSRFSNSASPAAPIGLENSGSNFQNPAKKSKFSRLISYAPGAVLLVAAACGGGEEVKTHREVNDVQTPTASASLATEPIKAATEAPKVVVTEAPKMATPEPVKLLSPSEITALIDSALINVADSDKKTNVKNFVRRAEAAMADKGNPSNIVGTLNDYGNAERWIVQFACEYPGNSKLADAYFAIRDVSLNLIKEQSGKGVIAADAATSFTKFNLQIPSDCKNSYLLQGSPK